jgi:hypothetical protein
MKEAGTAPAVPAFFFAGKVCFRRRIHFNKKIGPKRNSFRSMNEKRNSIILDTGTAVV